MTMMTRVRAAALGAAAMLLAACAALPPAEVGEGMLPVDVERFTLEGKVGWRHPEGRGSANLTWEQYDDDFRLLLTGPLGAGAVLLESDANGVRLDSPEGERHAAVADDLLAETLGFSVPVDQARWWVLGLPAPVGVAITTAMVHEEDEWGRAAAVEQDGWRIRWSDRRLVDDYSLPRRIVISRGEMQLTLVVGAWSLAPPAAGQSAMHAPAPN